MGTRRTGLGRGLDALIPHVDDSDPADFAIVAIGSVIPNPQQPRTGFDPERLSALAASIREVGILQPLVVRPPEDGTYMLVAGERRLRAAREVGLAEVPVVIREVDDDQVSLTAALIENLQREDLRPLEEAAAYKQLLEDFGLTHQEIGDRVAKSRSAVSNSLRLLTLPASIQGMVERGELAAGHARALVGLEDYAYAEHIGKRAAEEGWSVRQVEEAVRNRSGDGTVRQPTEKPVRPVAIIELEERLGERLGTPVVIKHGSASRGKILISYSSVADLERIYRVFYE